MADNRYPGPENIHHEVLANGITILVLETKSTPMVVVEGIVRAAAIQESPEKSGLASFTADMLLRGTQQREYAEIFERLESVGANLMFAGGRHATHFSGAGLIEDFDLIIELLAQSLRTPLFPEQYVARVRGQIETGFQIRANDTQRMAGLTFMETAYRGHPYGRSLHGYPETISGIEVQDLIDFHAQNYGPRGMILAVVGAIAPEEAISKIAAHLADWENPRPVLVSTVNDMPWPQELLTVLHEMPAKPQSDLVLGLPGPRRSAPDYLHASLMNTVLGVFGNMGRIGQVVREEQGLAYYATSQLTGGPGPGPWTAEVGTSPGFVPQVIQSIRSEIERIQCELVTPLELDDCKLFRIGSLPVSLETNASLADIILDLEFYNLGLDYLQRFPDLIRNISADDVQSAAQKYLSTDQLVVSIAGPKFSSLED